MKIQDLAIIFIIIILPISIVLSVYTQFQMNTLNLQTIYDSKLTAATYDAIKAFQINTANSTLSDLSNSKIRDIEASVSTFRNSLKSTFRLNGYTEEELNNYIPALVYTMYDGFYIYSPFENTNYYGLNGDGETMYGLKPYITYSCRYIRGNIDVVITYSLDNYITIQGYVPEGGTTKYIQDQGYLIDGITKDASGKITYNGIEIEPETNLQEYCGANQYPYIKVNGTKYYYYAGATGNSDDEIFYLTNGTITTQGSYVQENAENYYNNYIKNNTQAYKYYNDAMEFTQRIRNTYNLKDLRISDAVEISKTSGNLENIWPTDNRLIFATSSTNIEYKKSNFNEHRLETIRRSIEKNLSTAIANYNGYSQATTIEFQMPNLTEEEWARITDNISLISFVQGLYIGGKIYNGYTIVNNTESKEVIPAESIYLLCKDNYYRKVTDKDLKDGGVAQIEDTIPSGRQSLDFKRKIASTTNTTRYYYPLKQYNASYSSIVTQDKVEKYDDIYEYVNSLTNNAIKKAFYTALGRERQASYKVTNINSMEY